MVLTCGEVAGVMAQLGGRMWPIVTLLYGAGLTPRVGASALRGQDHRAANSYGRIAISGKAFSTALSNVASGHLARTASSTKRVS